MKFHCLRENENFRIYWNRGQNNDDVYFTKHHTDKHHKNMRPTCILKGFLINWNKKSNKSLQPMCGRVY